VPGRKTKHLLCLDRLVLSRGYCPTQYKQRLGFTRLRVWWSFKSWYFLSTFKASIQATTVKILTNGYFIHFLWLKSSLSEQHTTESLAHCSARSSSEDRHAFFWIIIKPHTGNFFGIVYRIALKASVLIRNVGILQGGLSKDREKASAYDARCWPHHYLDGDDCTQSYYWWRRQKSTPRGKMLRSTLNSIADVLWRQDDSFTKSRELLTLEAC